MFVLEGAARLVADQAPGQDVHPVSLPGIRAASDKRFIQPDYNFRFRKCQQCKRFCLFIEYAGIQQIINLDHFFRMAGDCKLRGCGLHEAAQG